MGASIDIYWMDGPTTDEVDAVVKLFEGADFDGMVDLKTHNSHWMEQDGTVTMARRGGAHSWAAESNASPSADAVEVHFGADYISTNRDESKALLEAAAAAFYEEKGRSWGWDIPEIKETDWYVGADNKPKGKHANYVEDYDKMVEGDPYHHSQAQKYRMFASKFSAYEKPAEKPKAQTVEVGENGYKVEHVRDWTWLYFAGKPSVDIREAIKAIGFRWSRKRGGWYNREHTPSEMVKAAIDIRPITGMSYEGPMHEDAILDAHL
jgi:hypothetical protein